MSNNSGSKCDIYSCLLTEKCRKKMLLDLKLSRPFSYSKTHFQFSQRFRLHSRLIFLMKKPKIQVGCMYLFKHLKLAVRHIQVASHEKVRQVTVSSLTNWKWCLSRYALYVNGCKYGIYITWRRTFDCIAYKFSAAFAIYVPNLSWLIV